MELANGKSRINRPQLPRIPVPPPLANRLFFRISLFFKAINCLFRRIRFSESSLPVILGSRFSWYGLIFCAAILCGNEGTAQDPPASRSRESVRPLPLPARSHTSQSNPEQRGKAVSSISPLVSTAVSLGLIVGALFLVGRILKKQGFRGPSRLPDEALELLGRRTLEPRVSIHLVKCGGRILVLGVGPDGIRTLSEIDDPLQIEQLTSACRGTLKEDLPLNSGPAATTSGLKSRFATVSNRALGLLLASGLSLAITLPAEAQSNRFPDRAPAPANRSRDSVQSRGTETSRGTENPVHEGTIEVPATVDRSTSAEPAEMESGIFGSPQQMGLSLKMVALMSIFSLAPSLLMMSTCYVRFTVALGLLRQALGTQQGLPSPVLTAICLFLTFLVMAPVWQRSYEEGIRPYTSPAAEESPIDEATALARTLGPVRAFMGQQIDQANNSGSVWMLLDFQRSTANSTSRSSWQEPQSYDEVPITVLAPAYLLSELKVGFLIGFQLFLPFLVIDLVVAMILTSLGLTMMPPAMVSLPFKLLLFVLIDGWFLIVGMLLESVRVV